MAAKSNKSTTKITRIKAKDTPVVKDIEPEMEIGVTEGDKTAKDDSKEPKAKRSVKPLHATGGYFKGAWAELKQVRWPTRRATWGLTLAVVLFTLFFVAFIVFLDTIFQQLFDLMLG